jgi:hypothetical protein
MRKQKIRFYIEDQHVLAVFLGVNRNGMHDCFTFSEGFATAEPAYVAGLPLASSEQYANMLAFLTYQEAMRLDVDQ